MQSTSQESIAIEKINWDFLDGAYLITTSQIENKRLEKTKFELESVNLWDKIIIRTFPTDDEDRVRGCYTSHIQVLQEIQKTYNNQPNYQILIVEDNIEKTIQIDSKIIKNVDQFLQSPINKQWDIFHLAYMMYVPGLAAIKLNTEVISTQISIQLFS
jgi:hypothetical protein